ncbi:organic cation/carnitine transporter 4, partial [Ananas comosus]|uniref:H(+)/Pi cotransporter n=1 Tax=Ananas comosus TaxID=4615 RepID=A0A6P5GTY0_ANACO
REGPEERRRMGIDEVLQRHAGEFGAWQLRHFLLTSAAWALEALHTMVMIFADREPPRFCALGPGRCADPDPCRPASAGWAWAGGPGASTVAQWGLVCADRYKVGLVQSTFFAGCMLGAGVFGHLSDSFLGRKGSLLVVCILNTVFGLLTALSPSYWTYVGLRLLTGFSTGGVGLCAFVLATEPVGPTKRGPAGMSTFYFFSGGIAVLSGIAYLFPSWRILYIVTSLPSFLFLILILPFISESPRWYLVRRRTDEAMDVMRAIARANGKDIPNDITLKLDDDDSREQEESNNLEKGVKEQKTERAAGGSIVDVLRTPMTRLRLILTVAINFLCSIVYYGLSLNVVNLKTNLYLSVLLNAVAEMPAFVLTAVLLDRFGRKPLGVGTMWLSGVFCIVGSMVGGYGAMKIVRMVCGILGIFGMAATYNLLFIYTAELFPTVVRNAALGCATQASQMGAILAPMVVVLGDKVPFAVFGLSGIVGGILVFYLPETMNKPLYDTMAGMEEAENKILLK